LCIFCGQNGLNAKDIHKEMLPVYGEKYMSRKPFSLCGKRFLVDEEVETEVDKRLGQQSKASMLRVSTHS
jgi:hypothetical protein